MSRRWLITGVSSGLGRALAEAVLARGEIVTASFRNPDQAEHFERATPKRAYGCVIDLATSGRVREIVSASIERMGGVDVVVNNAGYGLTGAVEEVSEAEARRIMEVNFFGALAVTQAALPFLRRQRRGHIINITSTAGMVGYTGLAMYCASKFAVEGLAASLTLEARPLGIFVTNVEPGSFLTNWRTDTSLAHAAHRIDDYAEVVGGQRHRMLSTHGQQEGDPAKAALAILKVVDSPNPPLHLPLNPQAWSLIRGTLEQTLAEMDTWSAVSHDTTFPGR